MSARSSGLGVLAIVSLLLAACAGDPPLQELRVYDNAFGQARSAGEDVLDQAETALAVKADREEKLGGGSDSLFPDSFDPETVTLDPDADVPSAIRVRRLALRTIAEYNEALLALAEGRTLAQVQSRVESLGQTVQKLLPLVGLAGGPLPGLVISGLQSAIAAAEEAREREAVEDAILEGHDEVAGIIDALIADTPDLYTLLRSRWQFQLDDADKEMGDVWRSMESLARAHRAASSPADVKQLVAVEQRAERAFASTTPPSQVANLPQLTLAPAAQGGAPFDAATIGELQNQAGRLEAAASRYASGVEAINLAHDAMRQYVLLLRRARQSLDDLKAAVAAPPDANAVLMRVVESGVELRRQADQVQRILGALRAR